MDALAAAGGQQVLSPYHAMACNPALMVDPLGLMSSVTNLPGVEVIGHRLVQNVGGNFVANGAAFLFEGSPWTADSRDPFDETQELLDRAIDQTTGGQPADGDGDPPCKGCSVGPFDQNDSGNGFVTKDLTKEFNDQLEKTEKFFKSRKDYHNKRMKDLANSRNIRPEAFLQLYTEYIMEFYNLVKTNSPYDLKNNNQSEFSQDNLKGVNAMYNGQNFRFDDFGNYNFGFAARAYGLSLDFSKFAAGLYQIFSGTSNLTWMKSYFDDPRDSKRIQEGYNHK